MFKQTGRHWEYNLIHPIPALALIGRYRPGLKRWWQR